MMTAVSNNTLTHTPQRIGTLDVRVRGNTVIPPSILGRFSILCAILRQLHLLLQIYATSEMHALQPDAFFVDQLSAGLPLLRLLLSLMATAPLSSSSSSTTKTAAQARIFFYTHYPDLLLARGRDRWWKRAYRVPFDALEHRSMGFADAVAVNSNFTRSVVARTWPDLARRKDLLTVYPCVDTDVSSSASTKTDADEDEKPLWNGKPFLLSINRFERKKDIALAIRAFAGLSAQQRQSQGQGGAARLVVAGGYDARVAENVGYHKELEALAEAQGLSSRTARTTTTALFEVPDDIDVVFLLSVPNALKEALLRDARLLVYTPASEHFGIVPLEAMLRGVPVLAADSGGPVETVVEGETGWLRDPTRVELWTEVMDLVLNRMSVVDFHRMRTAGVKRVKDGFGQDQMALRLDGIFEELLHSNKSDEGQAEAVLFLLLAVGSVLVAAVAAAVAAAWVLLVPFLAGKSGEQEEVVWAEA